jgi:hypothetical protein
MALMVMDGFLISSVTYKIRSEGRANTNKISAGKIVHIVSTICASRVYRLMYLFIIVAIIA